MTLLEVFYAEVDSQHSFSYGRQNKGHRKEYFVGKIIGLYEKLPRKFGMGKGSIKGIDYKSGNYFKDRTVTADGA